MMIDKNLHDVHHVHVIRSIFMIVPFDEFDFSIWEFVDYW